VLAILRSLGLLVGYPLSIRPMAMIYGMAGQPKFLLSAIDVIYAPLGWLPDSLGRPISEWAEFCFDLTP
jgi:hypothetical protein